MDWNKVGKWCVDSLREMVGEPVAMRRFLEQHRVAVLDPTELEETTSIAMSSVRPWHAWGDNGVTRCSRAMSGWRDAGGGYESISLELAEFNGFGCEEVIEAWSCDITDVHGLLASKSPLRRYPTLDDFAQARAPRYISPISEELLNANLAHSEIRILHDNSDYLVWHGWDGRVFLANSGGSHHFAAARYIAANLGKAVPLTARLYRRFLNADAVIALAEEFEVFVLSDDAVALCAFQDAMASCRATYLWRPLPAPLDHMRAVFFPRDEDRAARVAREFRRVGAIDLMNHLKTLVAKQDDNVKRIKSL